MVWLLAITAGFTALMDRLISSFRRRASQTRCFSTCQAALSSGSYGGPPSGPGGRAVFYTLVVTIQFVKTQWDFDDPWDDSETAPAPQCGVHDSLTAHKYREISESRHPDQRYHVVAHEHYAISAEVFYLDSYGLHHDAVPTSLDDVVVSTEPRPVYVGQIEAIPITPTR